MFKIGGLSVGWYKHSCRCGVEPYELAGERRELGKGAGREGILG